MPKEKIFLSTVLAILCTAVVISTLFLNNPRHSHAAGSTSAAPSLLSNQSSLPTSGIVSGNIFYGSNGSSVYALNATTGVMIWKYTYHPSGYTFDWLLGLHNGVLYASLSDYSYFRPGSAYVAALEATSGSVLWLSPQTIYGAFDSFQIADGNIYIHAWGAGEGTVFYTLKVSDGSLLWSFGGSTLTSTPVISQGVVYTYFYYTQGPPDNQVCALNANDGSERWCYLNDAEIAAVVNGVVYTRGYDPNTGNFTDAIALNANDGSVRWSVSGTLIKDVVQNIVYVTNQNGTGALNASTGTLLIEYQNTGFLFLHQGVIYAVGSSNNLEALKQNDGTLLWQYNFGSAGLSSCSHPFNGALYCWSTDQHTIYALSAASGTLLWQHNFGGAVGDTFGGPSPSNGVLYCFGPGNTMYALGAAHGTLLWQHTFKKFENWLMGLNGIVYVLTEIITNDVLISAHVHAFNASNGTLLWNY